MIDRKALGLSVTLLIIGQVLLTFATLVLHPEGGDTLQGTFANFAASGDWAAVHLMQFAGMGLFLAGLLALFFAVNVSQSTPRWAGFFGALSTGVALALAGILYAVDGVANKQAVDAWVSAPSSELAVRFANAQALRELETGTSSYQDLTLGLALMLLGIMIVWTARIPRPIGYLMTLSGLAWLVVSWLVGTGGFTSATTVPIYTGQTLLTVWLIWLLIVAWRRKESAESLPDRPATA